MQFKMPKILVPLYLITLCLIPISIINAKEIQTNKPEKIIHEYIESVKLSDWEKAKSFWLPEIIEKSEQKNIRYENTFVKYDCTSPILRLLKNIKSDRLNVQIYGGEILKDKCTIPVSLSDGRTAIDHEYILIRMDDKWQITSPLYYNTSNWYILETDYCRVIFNDSSRINDYAINKLDKFIKEIIETLNIPEDRIAVLEESKIDYFLCNEIEIKELTGFQIHGLADLRFDAIITRHLPHQHELVHLLYNFALQELPLYTLPLFQEGVAVALGGRWQKRPEVIMQLGNVLINGGFISLDSMLTKYDFEVTAGTPDITYPVCGLFTNAIINEYGFDALESIYRDMSGDIEKVSSLSSESIKESVLRNTGCTWAEIENMVIQNGTNYVLSGLNIIPNMPAELPVRQIANPESFCIIWENDSSYIFEINCSNPSCQGSVLFWEKEPGIADSYSSIMYYENPNHPEYSLEMYGIDFDSNEVGLYDFYTDCLLAKYIAGFYDSSIQSLFNNNTLRFSISKNLFEYSLDRFDILLTTI